MSTSNMTALPWNMSEEPVYNMTSGQEAVLFARHVINRIVIPLVCSFGIVANCINLGVFGRRWGKRNTTSTEKAAMVGLIALAVSDLTFCIFGVPNAFLDPTTVSYKNNTMMLLAFYYVTYRQALMNMALYSSTWCIVIISLERYLAVCHPFQARLFIRIWKAALLHLAVFLCGILITLPEFLKYSIMSAPCQDPEYICYARYPREEFRQYDFLLAYRILWLSVGTFIPLAVMCFCNIRLLMEIYRSKMLGLTDPDRYCTTKLTLTVAGIISMFFVLVCPSMILSFVDTILIMCNGNRSNMYKVQVAMIATNLLQAIKFSCNFFWYCAVNNHFRETLECAMRRRSWSRTSSDSPNKVEMTLLK